MVHFGHEGNVLLFSHSKFWLKLGRQWTRFPGLSSCYSETLSRGWSRDLGFAVTVWEFQTPLFCVEEYVTLLKFYRAFFFNDQSCVSILDYLVVIF